MLINSVHIEGFWNKYSLNWKLNKDVNLLSGINGSGKTTLLHSIVTVLYSGTLISTVKNKIRYIDIQLTDGYRICCENHDDDIQTVCTHDNQEISFEEFSLNLNLEDITTFDSNLPNEEKYKQYVTFKKDRVRSELDLTLDETLNDYYKYLAIISREVEYAVKNKKENLDSILNLYKRKNHFTAKVNELFAPTRKKWDETSNEVRFLLEDGKAIPPQELSSGEKQLLILLFSTLTQNGEEFITFWDEPEISMHIDWQRALIRTVREINPSAQLIIATHSPSIIYEGWEKRVVNMEDLLQ